MKRPTLSAKIYHKSIELDALSSSFNSIEEAENAKIELHSHLEMRARILLCRHLHHYSQNNFQDWDIGNFDIKAISGYKVIKLHNYFKLVRAFQPSEVTKYDLDGYMPYANPEDEFSWSVLFKVKDNNGDLIDRQIMESAPMLGDENDLAKTEYESLLYVFEKSLKTDLESSFSAIDCCLSKTNKENYNIMVRLDRVYSRLDEIDDALTDIKCGVKGQISRLRNKVIPIGMLVILSMGGHAYHLYNWMVVGILK